MQAIDSIACMVQCALCKLQAHIHSHQQVRLHLGTVADVGIGVQVVACLVLGELARHGAGGLEVRHDHRR